MMMMKTIMNNMYEDDQSEIQSYQKTSNKEGDSSMIRIKHFTWSHIERMTGLR